MPFDYRFGATGFITWWANVDPPIAFEIDEICVAGDTVRAQALYQRLYPLDAFIREAVRKGGVCREIALVKEMCRLAGRPMGSRERLPVIRPVEEERRQLARLMREAGIF